MTRRKLNQLIKFSVVGFSVAAIYFALFMAFRCFGVSRLIASPLAFIAAVVFQYVAQTWWTFEAKVRNSGNVRRFSIMIAIGLLLSTAITNVIGPLAGIADSASALIVVVVLPVSNYLLMSLWVYRGDGGREVEAVERKP